MLNRRLIYSKISPPYLGASTHIEKIDNYLNETKYLNPVNNSIFIYGNDANSDVLVGREITGREQEAYYHDEFLIKDFSVSEFEMKVIEASTLNNLISQIKELNLKLAQFRVKWNLENPNQFEVYFF